VLIEIPLFCRRRFMRRVTLFGGTKYLEVIGFL
jgi:hypothetical protein